MNTATVDHHIPWFNPREMDDATVLALATGRDDLLYEFLQAVRYRLDSPEQRSAGAHWLVTGTRGAGKSYFLRFAQIQTTASFPPGQVLFVLLPEELRNVRAPHDLLDEIRRMLQVGQGNQGRAAMWRTDNPEQAWQQALQQLLAAFDEKLLVVGVENFAQLLGKAFDSDVSASLLRKLMEHEPRVLFLATAVDGTFDEKYQQRLFRQFEHHPMPTWDGQAHRQYLRQRAKLLQRKPTAQQLARIDAYSRYTGGNARVAAILAAAILEEQDLVNASADLNATLDKMSDYYRALLDPMPPNTETLFDALVRGGEPCSQTQLAQRVGAKQNEISRAFHWLLDGGYLHASRPKGQKETLYQVADRLFVQWYRMRYLDPGQHSRLAVLAELLADTVAFGDKWRYAQGFAEQGEDDDALLMAELAYKERGIDMRKLQATGMLLPALLQWGQRLVAIDEMPKNGGNAPLNDYLDLLEAYPNDESMRHELHVATTLVKNCHRFQDSLSGEALITLCMGSLSLAAVKKLRVAREITKPDFSQEQWDGFGEVFQEELVEFEKLKPTQGEFIQGLKEKCHEQLQHPWLLAWEHIQESANTAYFKKHPKPEQAILQATANAVLCLHALRTPDQEALADGAATRLLKQLWPLIREQGWCEDVLSLLERLLMALPEGALPRQRGELQYFCSKCLTYLDRHAQSLAWARQAQTIFQSLPFSDNQQRGLAAANEQLGWANGEANQWQAALQCHQEALTQLPVQDQGNRSWHAGQAARYLWHVQGLDAAWQFIHAQGFKEQNRITNCIGQLGDAVYDVQRNQGAVAAYAKGRELFLSLKQQADLPRSAVVRTLFIDMLDTGLELSVLQDLVHDLLELLTANEGNDEDQNVEKKDNLVDLAQAIGHWFTHLQKLTIKTAPGNLKQVTVKTETEPLLDPDWVVTLQALTDALSIQARIRLGLATSSRLRAEAVSAKARMMAFLKPDLSDRKGGAGYGR